MAADELTNQFPFPPGTLSGPNATLLLPLPIVSNTTDINPSTNATRFARIVVPLGILVATISFEVQTGEGGKLFGVGIYSNDGLSKLIDSGAVSVAGTGVKTTTLTTPYYLQPGEYIMGWTSDTAGATLIIRGITLTTGPTLATSASPPITGTAANAGAAGVLPSTLGTLTGASISGSIPLVRLTGS